MTFVYAYAILAVKCSEARRQPVQFFPHGTNFMSRLTFCMVGQTETAWPCIKYTLGAGGVAGWMVYIIFVTSSG